MRSNRSADTGPEIVTRQALWANGLRGYRKNVPWLPGKPDIVFPAQRVCVFVHGCFWHGCIVCAERRNLRPTNNSEYWALKLARNKERDDRNCHYLACEGWRVVIVWECEVSKDLSAVIQRIRAELAKADDLPVRVNASCEMAL